MQRVFVLSNKKHPLMPCHPARARALLREKKASVFKRYPFTIILHDRDSGDMQPVEIKLDPGSKTTGLRLTYMVRTALKPFGLRI
jgi:hypothetical protein